MAGNRDKYGPTTLPHGNKAVLYALGLAPFRVRSPWAKKLVVWAFAALVAALLIGCVAVYGRSGTLTASSDRFQKRTTALYNPSIKVRFPDVGVSVINAYYNGCLPPVQISSALTWPSQGKQADDGSIVGSCTDPATGDPTDPDQAISRATVSNVAFYDGHQVPLKVGSAGYGKNSYEEINTYTALVNNQPLTIAVTLGIQNLDVAGKAPILLSLPTLGPPPADSVPDTTNKPDRAGLPGYDGTDNPALTTALTNWATAWASNNQDGLKQSTQDTTSRVYTGLGGWQLTTQDNEPASVTWSWGYVRTVAGVKYAAAQVTFTISSTDETGKKKFASQQTMDILVKGYNTSLPAVVAWGSPGTWSTLTPYQNGVKPDPNAAPPTSGPASSSTAPTPSSTPSR